MDRREARERAKGIIGSPSLATSPAADGADNGDQPAAATGTGKKGRSKKNAEGTGRRCANCGQVGHIKTNKKSASDFSTFATPAQTSPSSSPFSPSISLCEFCSGSGVGIGGSGFGTIGPTTEAGKVSIGGRKRKAVEDDTASGDGNDQGKTVKRRARNRGKNKTATTA